MSRLALVLALAVVSPGLAHADVDPKAPPIDAALAAKLKRGGWVDAAIASTSPKVTVVTARKGKVIHVLLVSPTGAIVDGGTSPTIPSVTETTSMLSDLAEVQLGYRTERANEGYDQTSKLWLVRPDGSVACRLTGASSTSTGKGCGSGGWTSVRLETALGARAATIDVTTENSGTWSEPDGKGGCLNRSPVRSGPMKARYLIPAKGMCKKVAVPAGANREPPGM
ncbi:MAG: hypothetical protein IPQ07_09755 [Myxococcales bacterium]|nr:hypothetical protein [Myxococcales bacterium]